jgi:hypothetical protein
MEFLDQPSNYELWKEGRKEGRCLFVGPTLAGLIMYLVLQQNIVMFNSSNIIKLTYWMALVVLKISLQTTCNLFCAETLEREMERVQTAASQMCGHHIPGLMPQLQARGVVQAVKAVCALMGNVETQDITESVEGFESICLQFIPAPSPVITDVLYYML